MNFTVYSKQGCPYCEKVKTVLNDLKTKKDCNTVYYELGKDFTREQFYDEFGQGSTFPQVIFNNEHIGGCTDTVKYLMENKMI